MPVAKSRTAQHHAVHRAQASDRPESGRKFKPTVPVATCDEPTFSPNETLWNAARARLIGLEASKLDDLGPLLGFVGDELAKVAGRARKHSATKVGKARLHPGVGKPCIDLAVKLLDDFGRRGLWCADAGPGDRF